ncbi:MAG: hypothetical protein AAF447_09830 [Myxococcota bacterium]
MGDETELKITAAEGEGGLPALPREAFLALAAIGWADGDLDAEEADAIVAAALDAGYGLEEVTELEAATKEPPVVAELDFGALSPADRAFTFSVAVWVSALDGDRSPDEVRVLGELGAALGLDEDARAAADARIVEVAARTGEHRPGRFDLAALRALVDADDWLAALGAS